MKRAKKLTLKQAWEKVARMRVCGICVRINRLQWGGQITRRQAAAMRRSLRTLILDAMPDVYVWPCDRWGNRARREFALERARRCRS